MLHLIAASILILMIGGCSRSLSETEQTPTVTSVDYKMLAGKTFRSVNLLEVGEQSDGTLGYGHWRIHFDEMGLSFDWSHSDMIENVKIESHQNQSLRHMPDRETLIWDSQEYQLE